jgi:DNA-binding MarR family transcriptional regulator
MDRSATPKFTHCSAAVLRMAARRVSQFYDAHLAPEGLKVSQYSVLSTAARRRERPPTVNELAEDLGMDRSTLGHNLRPLERDGLVTLQPDGGDKRIRRVTVTELGQRKRRACRDLWAVAQERFEEAFGSSRAADLAGLLSFIARDLDLDDRLGRSPAAISSESPAHVR